jgi:hypothetical protein
MGLCAGVQLWQVQFCQFLQSLLLLFLLDFFLLYLMCFDATAALSAEIDKDIWQASLTRPMYGMTTCSQTNQLEEMRAFETKLDCSILWPQP